MRQNDVLKTFPHLNLQNLWICLVSRQGRIKVANGINIGSQLTLELIYSDYPGGLNRSQGSSSYGRGRQKSWSQREILKCYFDGFENKGRAHEPESSGGSTAGIGKKTSSPQSSRMNSSLQTE